MDIVSLRRCHADFSVWVNSRAMLLHFAYPRSRLRLPRFTERMVALARVKQESEAMAAAAALTPFRAETVLR